MRILSTVTVGDIEGLFSQLLSENKSLTVPSSFKNLKVGAFPRLIQFFITAGKQNPEITVSFPTVGINDEKLKKDIIGDPRALSALLMFEKVLGMDGKDLKKKMNPLLIERFDQPYYIVGRALHCMAIDHSINDYAYPKCFYDFQSDQPVTKAATFYHALVERFINEKGRTIDIGNNHYTVIGELISEILDNTDQHGRSDFLNGKTNNSIRGLFLNYRLINRDESIDHIAGVNTAINAYLNSLKDEGEPIHLLEISIVDSGCGILRSFNQEDTDFSEEIKVTTESFLKGVSSKPNSVGFGRGLDLSRKILNERSGYIALRTGRLSLYRDFNNTPLLSTEESMDDDIRFYDESTQSEAAFTELSRAEGLSYTILVPLK